VLPILFRLGPIAFPTYTILIDIGIAAGLAWLYFRAPQGKAMRWLDAGLAATVGGFVGARLLYVVVNGGYYLWHPGEALRIWEGGLAWPGAALGGLAGLWLFGLRQRDPLAPLLDALALPIALLGLLGWGGCLAASCAYGFEATPGQLPAWLVLNAPDLYGLVAPRFPTQVIGLLWSLVALGMVWAARDRGWPPAARGWYALSLAALGAFFLGFTRGDPMPLVGGLRLDVVGSALILITTSVIWGRLLARKSPAQSLTPPSGAQAVSNPQLPTTSSDSNSNSNSQL
jgi:phosphatidylglycerol:prolipoprotein diacylglycerol transferase